MTLCLSSTACGVRNTPPVGDAGADAKAFVVQHRAELQAEIAAGSGPRIYNLAIIADCQDVPTLSRRLHRHHDDFFGSAGVVPGGAAPGGAAPAGPVADADVADRVVRFMSDNREFRCLSLDRSRTRMMAAGTRHIGPRRSQVTARGGSW
ncbi:MAG TPA: hypothetical protein VMG12_22455 [Polyangiaceae bacterium]|nr:hypothetical protein [Polyangiaceae bacterium]